MPKLDLDAIPETNRTGYPAPFDAAVAGRWQRRLAPVAGLTQFGATRARLAPGAWSSQRHWHVGEDELVVVVSGGAVLVDDTGETVLRAGDIAAFPANDGNGHHLQNRGDADCVFVAISAGPGTGGSYPDIDMMWDERGYLRKDGTPYDTERPG